MRNIWMLVLSVLASIAYAVVDIVISTSYTTQDASNVIVTVNTTQTYSPTSFTVTGDALYFGYFSPTGTYTLAGIVNGKPLYACPVNPNSVSNGGGGLYWFDGAQWTISDSTNFSYYAYWGGATSGDYPNVGNYIALDPDTTGTAIVNTP